MLSKAIYSDMKKYKMQMHTHTSPCSKCGAMTPQELALALYNEGYAGAVLTNHFYGGNSGIDKSLSWEEFVGAYRKDYIECTEAAKKYDLDIIFGVEEHLYGGKEILVFGVTPELIAAHPELRERKIELWREIVDSVGGLIVQAHPHRIRAYITDPGPLPLEYLDGIEVYNAANTPDGNINAREFAREHPELILTSGADTHSTDTVACGGIAAYERIRDSETLVRVLRSRKYDIIAPEDEPLEVTEG